MDDVERDIDEHFRYGSNDNGETNKENLELQLLNEKVTEQDIQFVIDTMVKEAKHDKISIKQIFVGMCGGIGNITVHHNVNSKNTGAGKSYLLILVSDYFPTKYILVLMGLSDKAFQHREGTMVLKDPITDELTPTGPIIAKLNVRIAELEQEIKEEKSKDTKTRNKDVIKNLAKQFVESQEEIKSILERQQKLIDLNNSIVMLLDTPQDSFYAGLMSLLSSDATGDQMYMFTDKTASGKLATKQNILRGSPAVFATRTIDDTRNQRFEEINRRFINVTPNVTPEKIRDANALIWERYGLTSEEYERRVVSTKDKERAKHKISVLVAKLKNHSKYFKPKQASVRIPFLYSIETPYNSEWAMTVNGRMVRYLTIITKIYMDNRPRLVRKDNPSFFYPISTFEDMKETLDLMELGGSNVRPYLANWYNDVLLEAYEAEGGIAKTHTEIISGKNETEKTTEENYVAVTSTQLIEKTLQVEHISITNSELRHKYIDPLINQGLVDKTRSKIRKNENIYWPVGSKGENIFSLFKDEDRKLRVTDPRRYPTKNFIMDSFKQTGTFGEMFGDNGDGILKNIFDIYRLEDENGVEITLEELAERYFSGPETCFKQDSNENFTSKKIEKSTPTCVAEGLAEHIEMKNATTNTDTTTLLIEKKPSASTTERAIFSNLSTTKALPDSSASKADRAKILKKCSECVYEDEAFYLKIHRENKHGISHDLEIRESKTSEYRTKPSIIWDGDVSKLIQIKGTEIGDQIVFDAYPAGGNFTLKNNFITGHLRMRGRGGGQYPYKYLEFINRVFDAAQPSRTIEVCSNRIPGLNKCGNCFTVDINPEYNPDFVTDGQTLEGIKDNHFDRWCCDPPYNVATAKEMYGTELPSYYKILEAGARVLKQGSLMFLLCSQNYQICPPNVKRIGFIYISVVPNNETRVLNIYVKLGNTNFEKSDKSTEIKRIVESEPT